jgi:hypothetical protein
MSMFKRLTGIALVATLSCGAGGNVARFAPCDGTDTCPSATVCESPGNQNTDIGTICTWSCTNPNVFNGQGCPSDITGATGVCVVSIGGTDIQNDGSGFCFQDCSSGNTCPTGETCQKAQPIVAEMSVMVCVPSASTSDGGDQ